MFDIELTVRSPVFSTLSICENYRPDLIILGHNNFLYRNNIEVIKTKYKSKKGLE